MSLPLAHARARAHVPGTDASVDAGRDGQRLLWVPAEADDGFPFWVLADTPRLAHPNIPETQAPLNVTRSRHVGQMGAKSGHFDRVPVAVTTCELPEGLAGRQGR